MEVRVNCEQNSLLYLVRPRRTGACHTKDAEGATRPSCYYRKVTWTPQEKSEAPVTEVISKCTTLEPLWCTDAPGVKRVSNQLAKSSLRYSSGKKGDRVCVGIELCQKRAYISVYSECAYTYLSTYLLSEVVRLERRTHCPLCMFGACSDTRREDWIFLEKL